MGRIRQIRATAEVWRDLRTVRTMGSLLPRSRATLTSRDEMATWVGISGSSPDLVHCNAAFLSLGAVSRRKFAEEAFVNVVDFSWSEAKFQRL